MRIFYLQREHDVSGVTGCGRVADGVEFDDGSVVIHWCAPGCPKSTGLYASLKDVEIKHGHEGLTHIVFEEDAATLRAELTRKVAEFEPSDRYEGDNKTHGPAYTAGYLGAIERVQDLLSGRINDWKDRKPPTGKVADPTI